MCTFHWKQRKQENLDALRRHVAEKLIFKVSFNILNCIFVCSCLYIDVMRILAYADFCFTNKILECLKTALIFSFSVGEDFILTSNYHRYLWTSYRSWLSTSRFSGWYWLVVKVGNYGLSRFSEFWQNCLPAWGIPLKSL